MPKKPSRRAQAELERQMRHRVNAGREAVRDQIPFFGRQFGQVASEWKEDDTRVTFADFAISEKVFAELRRDFPKDDYCSEEMSPQDEVLRLEARFAWLIDPIDGTNNFALGFPVCAISLALLLDGEPVYGFLYDHSTGSLLEGGEGAGLLRDRKKLDRDKAAADAQTMLGLHFPMEAEVMDRLKPLLSKYRGRCIGSAAMTGALVATGYLTGAIDYRVKSWDIAAAYALCRGAGVRFEFIGESPFPMREFHPSAAPCPYFAGSAAICSEFRKLLGEWAGG
ncbi:MAG: inositol monophosphatase family protein [Verrucomicrobiota bacterium]